MVYVYCHQSEVRRIRNLVKEYSNKKYMISSDVDTFRGINGPIHYTDLSQSNDDYEEFKYYRYWCTLLEFDYHKYTKLGQYLHEVESEDLVK
jgi:hypothetical protein